MPLVAMTAQTRTRSAGLDLGTLMGAVRGQSCEVGNLVSVCEMGSEGMRGRGRPPKWVGS